MVYVTKVSVDLASSATRKLKDLNAIIESNTQDIAGLFHSGKLDLKDNEVLIIRGPRGTLKAELDKHKGSYILLVRAADGKPYLGGADYLAIRACLVKTFFGKNDQIYITISPSSWTGYKFCPEFYLDRSAGTPMPNRNQSVRLDAIADELLRVATIKESEVDTTLN